MWVAAIILLGRLQKLTGWLSVMVILDSYPVNIFTTCSSVISKPKFCLLVQTAGLVSYAGAHCLEEMLTGKYRDSDTPPAQTRMAERSEVSVERYKQWVKNSSELVQHLVYIAERDKVSPGVVSLAWLLSDLRITAVVVGVKRPDQIHDLSRAGDWEIPKADWDVLEKLSRGMHPYPHDIYSYIDKEIALNWFTRIR